jgi:mannose-6-phosphate isomerase-like protein (cupin superfamily)
MTDPATAHLALADALARLAGSTGEQFVELFRHGTLRIELYAPRGRDVQAPHAQDEVYVVARGTGTFWDGQTRRPVGPGTLLFVAAGRPHRFEDFTADFASWVLFYGPQGGERHR